VSGQRLRCKVPLWYISQYHRSLPTGNWRRCGSNTCSRMSRECFEKVRSSYLDLLKLDTEYMRVLLSIYTTLTWPRHMIRCSMVFQKIRCSCPYQRGTYPSEAGTIQLWLVSLTCIGSELPCFALGSVTDVCSVCIHSPELFPCLDVLCLQIFPWHACLGDQRGTEELQVL
jgi:hypothetical protein